MWSKGAKKIKKISVSNGYTSKYQIYSTKSVLRVVFHATVEKVRLNCSFSLLTFSKLRFLPPKKKTTKQPPKFCTCGSFDSQG